MKTLPAELVILIWLHGFKGGDDTFGTFPDRIVHLLSNQTSSSYHTQVESTVYPAYDTRGELVTAVSNHHKWLTELVKDKSKVFRQEKGEDGVVRVVLIGHSMGGLVAADVARKCELVTDKEERIKVLGVLAYDTPYLGLNPAVFKGAVEKVLGYAQFGQAALAGMGAAWGWYKSRDSAPSTPATETPPKPPSRSTSSTNTNTKGKSTSVTTQTDDEKSAAAAASKSWFTPALVGGAASALLAAGAGAAFVNRDKLAQHWDWATSHLSYVGELWKGDLLEERVAWLVGGKVHFHCFHTSLPAAPKADPKVPRTFCLLPTGGAAKDYFSPNTNTKADDEIAAHVEMFTEHSDGMYTLGRETDACIRHWLDVERQKEAGKQ